MITLIKQYGLLILFFFILSPIAKASSFPLITPNKPLHVYFDEKESAVVHTAVQLFSSDMETVSGIKPMQIKQIENLSVIIGTIGKSTEIDQLIRLKVISADKLQGKWEAFQIQVVQQEEQTLLVVAGSDSRGTAYGVLELSRLIGVSPWNWWADATPEKKSSLILPENYDNQQQPSVQYRGIFLNDEDWGLMPWSSKNYEPTTRKGEIGPKTYARIFELLLRLRANLIWPAMHEVTVPFYFVKGNKEMADKYGIVVGTSHCEPLMRNSAGEWDKQKYGEYNYLTNKVNICSYWEERLKETQNSENFYTIGMRGVHDGQMEGVKTLDEHTTALNQVIKDQRQLLSKYINTDVTKIPQAFVPYKEVLSVYDNGLSVPDDVTLVWCDDNYGYITRLSNPEEQKREGGAGVYYHVSYWGRPHDYLWLSTTQPALIYSEMKRAWDYNARKLWVLNVGDIKPAEYNMEFFLDMAWNIQSVSSNTVNLHLENWLSREFGSKVSQKVAPLMNEYYRLANIRKPEFMGWSRVEEASVKGGKTPVIDTEFNPFAFGDEIKRRVDCYSSIARKVSSIGNLIAPDKKDAYFQLVEYPIRGAAEMNRKLLFAQKARLYAKYQLPVANEYAELSRKAYQTICELTQHYNQEIQSGKWNGMMDMQPRKLPVFQPSDLPGEVLPSNSDKAVVWVENEQSPLYQETSTNIISKGKIDSHEQLPLQKGTVNKLPLFVKAADNSTFISLFQQGISPLIWNVKGKPSWLIIEEEETGMKQEKRLYFKVDWTKVKNQTKKAIFTLVINKVSYTFSAEASTIEKGEYTVEQDRIIALNAADYSGEPSRVVQSTQGLGHSLKAMNLLPGKENALTYSIFTTSTGNAVLKVCLLPTHPVNGGDLRYAVSIDDETPQIVSYKTSFRSETWKINVLRNQSVNETHHQISKTGKHTIKLYALDAGVIVDQLMLDFNPERKFYEIPAGK